MNASGAPTPRRVGFAVKVLGGGGLPSHDTRRWQSGPHLRASLQRLERIFDYLEETDIHMYRMASSLAPYASHREMPQFRRQVDDCLDDLRRLGTRARSLDVRLSTHPGQYTVLNSRTDQVVSSAAEELEVHAEILDAMELGPEAVIVLHVGGRAGGTAAALDRFEAGFEALSQGARSRLAIENDDRTFALGDVLELSRRIERPVVWDVLHHYCNDPEGISDRDALGLALDTWPGEIRPKIHFSSPRGDFGHRKLRSGRRVVKTVVLPPERAHADLIDPIAYATFLTAVGAEGRDFDVMLEAKGKDLALLRLRQQLRRRGTAL
jgi:UV DNA damage endonuclease